MASSAVAAAPTAASASATASSTIISMSDDERLFISGSSANSSSDGHPPVPFAKGGCPRAVQRRFRRVRHCLTHLSITFPLRRAASGLTVIAALLMVGIVGTFALRQMMSPEIEALTQQRERLKLDVTVLRLQVRKYARQHTVLVNATAKFYLYPRWRT